MAGEAAAVAPSSGPIPRPAVLKGLHYATVKRNLFASIGLCLVASAIYKVVVNDPKKRDYAEFYKWVPNAAITLQLIVIPAVFFTHK